MKCKICKKEHKQKDMRKIDSMGVIEWYCQDCFRRFKHIILY